MWGSELVLAKKSLRGISFLFLFVFSNVSLLPSSFAKEQPKPNLAKKDSKEEPNPATALNASSQSPRIRPVEANGYIRHPDLPFLFPTFIITREFVDDFYKEQTAHPNAEFLPEDSPVEFSEDSNSQVLLSELTLRRPNPKTPIENYVKPALTFRGPSIPSRGLSTEWIVPFESLSDRNLIFDFFSKLPSQLRAEHGLQPGFAMNLLFDARKSNTQIASSGARIISLEDIWVTLAQYQYDPINEDQHEFFKDLLGENYSAKDLEPPAYIARVPLLKVLYAARAVGVSQLITITRQNSVGSNNFGHYEDVKGRTHDLVKEGQRLGPHGDRFQPPLTIWQRIKSVTQSICQRVLANQARKW